MLVSLIYCSKNVNESQFFVNLYIPSSKMLRNARKYVIKHKNGNF